MELTQDQKDRISKTIRAIIARSMDTRVVKDLQIALLIVNLAKTKVSDEIL